MSTNKSANVLSHFEHFTTDLLSAAVLPYEESINNDGEIIVFDDKQSKQAVDQQNKRHNQAQITLLNAFTEMTKCHKIEDLFDTVLQVSAAIEMLDDNAERGSLSRGRKIKTFNIDGPPCPSCEQVLGQYSV